MVSTVEIVPSGAGTVTVSTFSIPASGYNYAYGYRLEASPSPGYRFVKFEGEYYLERGRYQPETHTVESGSNPYISEASGSSFSDYEYETAYGTFRKTMLWIRAVFEPTTPPTTGKILRSSTSGKILRGKYSSLILRDE